MPERLKSKIYRTVVRWVAFYGAESWLTTRGIEHRLIVMEMKMVRWMDCVTRLDHMAYGDIRKRFGIVLVGEKPHETCLRWYGHVLRASSDTMCKIGLTVEVRRGRGRPKQHWLDRMPADLKTMGVHPEQEYGRSPWRQKFCKADPASKRDRRYEEEEHLMLKSNSKKNKGFHRELKE
ncbi:unnamed protein product [Nippostrongylus brasiliensis]|uniref:Uncharacterized protein n=1 Tax=Nippostrongylus brasiliensis TaxID=27835 RepID=A0A0N4YTN0_NIPBR|nr:unnamed protein product [Nippostrongylus brasiliensis]